jgi:hypothetical protein
MAIEMSRQKHLIHSRRDLSSSMIGCTLDDSGNLINGRKLDRRFLPGIDTRRWENFLPKSTLAASSQLFCLFMNIFALSSHTHVHLTLQSFRVLQATDNKDSYKCTGLVDRDIHIQIKKQHITDY